jgi:hypothetical protein
MDFSPKAVILDAKVLAYRIWLGARKVYMGPGVFLRFFEYSQTGDHP